MKFFFTSFLLFVVIQTGAQISNTGISDTLQQVVVTAFEQPRKFRDVAAAVNFIGQRNFEPFSPTSAVQALNTTAGIRMEERSPGSYRINIRGSSLRSPFGVRNVKIYYNDLPFTDPGGQSYLNGLGYYNFNSVEIIKGPGGSVYGAGTGGVMLIESADANESSNVSAEASVGSFGLRSGNVFASTGNETIKNKIGFQYLKSDGYRQHSELERKIFSWTGRFASSAKGVLKTTFLYSQLFYETPGALTLTEYTLNPKGFRPSGGGFPSAEQNRAAIRQTIFLAGLNYKHQFSPAFSNSSSVYGMYTEFDNPAIRNYGKNREPHTGGRTSFAFRKNTGSTSINLVGGVEVQQGFSSVWVHKNRNGSVDSLQTGEEIPVRQGLVFLQAGVEKDGLELTLGGSLNYLNVTFRRTFPNSAPDLNRRFSNELAPRISLAKRWKNITVYSSIAEGFSPPTSAELFPSGGAANVSLNAEQGTNYDLGFRGTAGSLSFDVNAFYFRLRNTLAQRRDAGGGDYYVNAGKTSQTGVETSLNYPFLKSVAFVRQSFLWVSYTWHRFTYEEFKQLNIDFSGKRLPGTAPHTISTGIDVKMKSGLSATASYYFSDRIPLNDANSVYANAYHLVFARIGMEKLVSNRWRFKLTAGAENLLDEKYSLGNDINAFGGRYYNAAPGRSFYVSIAISILTSKPSLENSKAVSSQ